MRVRVKDTQIAGPGIVFPLLESVCWIVTSVIFLTYTVFPTSLPPSPPIPHYSSCSWPHPSDLLCIGCSLSLALRLIKMEKQKGWRDHSFISLFTLPQSSFLCIIMSCCLRSVWDSLSLYVSLSKLDQFSAWTWTFSAFRVDIIM